MAVKIKRVSGFGCVFRLAIGRCQLNPKPDYVVFCLLSATLVSFSHEALLYSASPFGAISAAFEVQ